MDLIPYGYHWLEESDLAAVEKALRGRWITQGPLIQRFEERVAEFCQAPYAVAFSSGTAALHAACFAAGIGAGDEVITTPLTFVASANAILYQAGRPVFADIDPEGLNLSSEEVRRRTSPKTKVILPVHFAGLPCDMEPLQEIAQERGLKIIEDACHAFGAEWTDRKGVRRKVGSCSHSDMTVFSFHPVKHITTGEGGMVLTRQKSLRDRLRIFRHHGMEDGQMQELGFNYRVTDFQCALGLSQLERAASFLEKRETLTGMYRQKLSGLGLRWQSVGVGVRHAWHLLVAQLPLEELSAGRDEILKRLRALHVGVQVHYLPVPLQPYYRRQFGYRPGDYPSAEGYYERALTLPLFPRMENSDLEKVVEAVRRVFAEVSRKEPVWNSSP